MNTILRCIILSRSAYALALSLQKNISSDYKVDIFAPEDLELEGIKSFQNCAYFLRQSYLEGYAILGICSTGILIRILAPFLQNKAIGAPVLTLTEDGKFCIPLLGAHKGANTLANSVAHALSGQAICTTRGEYLFGINLHNPPEDLILLNERDVKKILSEMLNGQSVKVIGTHDWLLSANLPINDQAKLKIILCDARPTSYERDAIYYLRKQDNKTDNLEKKGKLVILGIGPGNKKYLTAQAKEILSQADDIYGYHYYIALAAPFLPDQNIHISDNKEEMSRAVQALDCAARGRFVILLSSGDPGVFAMASTVMEALDNKQDEKKWHNIEVTVEPGITAALAASAHFGAPLGHDFSVISLSDNLKSWAIIEKRIYHALQADFALAIYNPVSQKRKENINKLLAFLKNNGAAKRLIAVAHDISRKDEFYHIAKVETLNPNLVTSRSILILGSSKMVQFTHNNKNWLYSPRFYNDE